MLTEYQESVAFHQWLTIKKIPHFHVPNETGGNQARGAMNKRMGVSKGVCDFFVFTPKANLAIEMKRRTGGTVSKEQREWLQILARHGFECGIAKGADEAIEFVNQFIEKERVEF